MTNKTTSKENVKAKFDLDVMQVINGFDFERVQKLMEYDQWRWRGQIPSVDQIRQTAIELLSELIDRKNINCSMGGLEADWEDCEGKKHLRLRFIFEESCSC